jgi:two-component system, OmpR family, phosphate regulon sensor histidine kinase PhoR
MPSAYPVVSATAYSPLVGDSARFKEKLFRHDLGGRTYFLHVDVPGQRSLLWQGMLPMLLTSALFMAIIVVAFLYTIRTIYRQKRIGEIRNDLVNNLTHELKTPISTIGLACEALTDPSMPKTEQQVRTFVTMIRDENKRLGALVENVLQSAVLESGHMLLKRVELDLHTVVQEVVRSSSIQVSRRNGRIDLDLKAEIHHVHGDRIHLTNLLYNLIDNAVKYAEQEPRIRIATVSNNEGVTISVTDNGIGIAPSEQRKIFDRLYRVPTGNLHNAKGFGLGLSYVRTVVERHGGRIKLESAPGRGSTFHIFIPFEHVTTVQATAGRR